MALWSILAKATTDSPYFPVRRVKCDETKPSCTRCTSTGRKCDGYPPVANIKRRQKQRDVATSESLSLVRQSSSPAFEIFQTDDEQRCFNFFKARTINDLSGFFPSEFWERLVPLATYHEPCLKHAVIALASLHERFEKGDRSILKSNKDILEGGFALQQYNKAIQHLIKQPRKPSFDTSLVACVLFACFETLRGHHGSALSHIHSGVQILTQANEVDQDNETDRSNEMNRLCVPRDTLDVIFARLDAQQVQVGQAQRLTGSTMIDVCTCCSS